MYRLAAKQMSLRMSLAPASSLSKSSSLPIAFAADLSSSSNSERRRTARMMEPSKRSHRGQLVKGCAVGPRVHDVDQPTVEARDVLERVRLDRAVIEECAQ